MGDEHGRKGDHYKIDIKGDGSNVQVGKRNLMHVGPGGTHHRSQRLPSPSSSDEEDGGDSYTVTKEGDGGQLQVGPGNEMNIETGIIASAQGKSYEDEEDPEECYKMDGNPRGFCYIFNNKEIKGEETRIGTDEDKAGLEEVFTKLRFTVKTFPNKTADEMDQEVKDLARKHICPEHNCVVVIFLTHGEDGVVKGSDNKPLKINTITSYFRKPPVLVNKPKLFFFESCRGPEFPKAVRVRADTTIDTMKATETVLVSPEADFYFGYATVPGTQAIRNLELGSWYIQELVNVLGAYANRREDARKEHFESLMIAVRRRVNTHKSELDDGTFMKQTSVGESSLLKKLYL